MDRTFQDLRRSTAGNGTPQPDWSERYDESGFGWDELLRSRRVLLVSEAGAGKSYECETRAQRLFSSGEPAFFLSLERVAAGGVAASLFGAELTRFTEWHGSSSQVAYFFLDSIDELQLVHGSFKEALRRFVHDIEGALGRAVVVVTARPVPIDRQAFRELLPVPPPPREAEPGEEFIRIAMDGPTRTNEGEPPAFREVELLPLTGPQITEFAHERGVSDSEALLAAIDAKNAREFARKPQDLIELCDDWREHGEIRSHREQIETHVRARLAARPDRREKAELSSARAREGVQRLALAIILSRRLTIRYSPGADADESSGPPLDPRELLLEWRPPEISAVLERPIFAEGGYGRVKFHHRSVLEYLAACEIHQLIETGTLSQSAAQRMLFGLTDAGKVVLKPSMRPVAGWLALLRTEIFDKVIERDPGTLLIQGDPESLSDRQRERVLLAFVQRYGKGYRRGLEVPTVQVARLAQLGLANAVVSAWATGVENPEVRELLIDLVAAGRLQPCADLMFEIAVDQSYRNRERFKALDALAKLGDARSEPTIDSALSGASGWDEQIGRWVGTMLYPEHVTDSQLLQLLSRLGSEPERSGDYADSVARVIQGADLGEARLQSLLPRVHRLTRDGLIPADEEMQERDGKFEASTVLRSLCVRLLELSAVTDELIDAAVLAMRATDRTSGLRKGNPELRDLLDGLPDRWRPKVFAADLACVMSLGPERSAGYRVFRLTSEGALRYKWDRDREWVLATLGAQDGPVEQRMALLYLAARLYAWHGSLEEGVAAIRSAVADSDVLTDELARVIEASKPSGELEKLQDEQRKREERQAKKEAAEREAWRSFTTELASRPALAFAPGRVDSTIWNLWLVLRKANRGTGEGRWDRAFLEAHLGADITDRLRRALMASWRGMKPTLKSERTFAEENTYRTVWTIGLLGIFAEAEDPRWCDNLNRHEASLASRYALLELDGLPTWLDGVARAHPEEVEQVIGADLSEDLLDPGGSSGWHSMVLQRLQYGASDTARLLLPRIIGWLAWTGLDHAQAPHASSHQQKLSQVLRVLIAHVQPQVLSSLADLAVAQFDDSGSENYRLFWLPVLFRLAPALASEKLLTALERLTVEREGSAVRMIGSLFDEQNGYGSVEWGTLAPDILLRLTLAFQLHVRPEHDLVHASVYSRGPRDFAEIGRRHAFDALISAGGPDALRAKLALAADSMFEEWKDRIAMLTQERLAAEVDASAWAPSEIAGVLAGKELTPKNGADMAQLLVDRIDDLQELMLSDAGPRSTWAAVEDENSLRPAIARELQVASRQAYTVDQEAVTADGKETDIRLRSLSGYQATIELKIGEKDRSARELCETIEKQLVEKYMAHRQARTGCLLVTVSNPAKRWRHPDTGEIDRFGLQKLLNEAAQAAQQRLGGEARVLAVVLDLIPRLGTEAEGKAKPLAQAKPKPIS